MIKIVQALILVSIVLTNIYASTPESKRQCDSEIKKEKPNLEIVKNQCLNVAINFSDNKEYAKASWYYLLAGEYKKNIDIVLPMLKDNSKTDYALANIANSFILNDSFDNGIMFYKKFLFRTKTYWKKNQIELNNEYMQEDFRILLKIYPKKNIEIENAKKIWKETYLNYQKYKDFLKKNQKNKAIEFLESMTIEAEKNNPNLVIFELKALARLYKDDRNYAKSIYLLKYALNLLERLQFNYISKNMIYDSILSVMHAEVHSYKKLNDYKKSIEKLKEILNLNKQLNRESAIHENYSSISEGYEILGNNEEALKYILKALRPEWKHQYTASYYNYIGNLHVKLFKYDDALKSYFKALKMWEELSGKDNDIIQIKKKHS